MISFSCLTRISLLTRQADFLGRKADRPSRRGLHPSKAGLPTRQAHHPQVDATWSYGPTGQDVVHADLPDYTSTEGTRQGKRRKQINMLATILVARSNFKMNCGYDWCYHVFQNFGGSFYSCETAETDPVKYLLVRRRVFVCAIALP